MKNRYFLSGVLLSFVILVVNDEWAKQAYPGWMTGKISDFAGLFLFALILRKVFPTYFKLSGIILAGSFFLWKSPLSSSLLATWNESGIWHLERVIDYTDWIAVSIIPLSWLPVFGQQERLQFALPGYFRNGGIAVFCLLVFCSTSRQKSHYIRPYTTSDDIVIDRHFSSSYSKSDILEILKREKIPLILNADTTEIYVSNLILGSDTLFLTRLTLEAKRNTTRVQVYNATANISGMYYGDRANYIRKMVLMYYRLRLHD